MNQVNLCGKIIRIHEKGKVTFVKLAIRSGRSDTEFIPVTVFQTEFFKKYFHPGKWLGVRGHIHVTGEEHGYTTEIIADDLYFIGDKLSEEQEAFSGFTPVEGDQVPFDELNGVV